MNRTGCQGLGINDRRIERDVAELFGMKMGLNINCIRNKLPCKASILCNINISSRNIGSL